MQEEKFTLILLKRYSIGIIYPRNLLVLWKSFSVCTDGAIKLFCKFPS